MLCAVGWKELAAESFNQCSGTLENQFILVHRDDSTSLCVHTDASDLLWLGIVTQIPHEDLSESHAVQRHQPLCFLSTYFSKVQLVWSTLTKEASPLCLRWKECTGYYQLLLNSTCTQIITILFFCSIQSLLFLLFLKLLCVRFSAGLLV